MRLFQLFRITGVANQTTFDDGLKSTDAEKKRLVAVHAQMEAQAGTDDNDLQGYHERAKVFDIPEKLIPAQPAATTTMANTNPQFHTIPVDLDIPAGEAFKVAMKCAATATDVRGAYEYEIIES